MNNVGLTGLLLVAVIWLLAHLEEKRNTKKMLEESDGIYRPASPPIQQHGNYRNSEGSGYEDLAMRDKDGE